jgi:drug/metabolite transporter (DMT)-like permease
MGVVFAIAAPVFLVLVSAVTKRLLSDGWKKRHFFVGIELAVAAIATLLDHFLDLFRKILEDDVNKEMAVNAVLSGILVIVAMVGLLYVLSLHRTFENDENRPKAQAFWLLFFANGVGSGLLIVYAVWVKG